MSEMNGAQTPAATAQPTATQQVATDWTSGMSETARGVVQNKGWKGPQDLLESYQNMEKLIGVPHDRVLKLPTKLDDAEAMTPIYEKLGRPSKPEGYGLAATEGTDGKFTDWASKAFHELGLSAKQGSVLAEKWNGFVKEVTEVQRMERSKKAEIEASELQKEWGAAHDSHVKSAQLAAREFGVTPEMLDAMESAVGYAQTMKFFHNLGSKIGEGNFVTGSKSSSFTSLSPAAAKSRIQQLKSDKGFIDRLVKGDVSAKEEWERLHKFGFSE